MDPVPYRLFISALLIIVMMLLRYMQITADSATEARMQQIPDKKALYDSKIEWLCKSKRRIHLTFQLLNFVATAFTVINVWLCTECFSALFAKFLIMLLYLFLILIFGIYVPTSMAKSSPDKRALKYYPLYRALTVLFAPVIAFSSNICSLILKSFRIYDEENDEVTENDILMMVDIGSSSGAIDPDEKEMIANIFEFDDTPARDIMTHRTDVDFLWLEDDRDIWKEQIATTNHTIYPICTDSVDDIAGIISSRDFYKMLCGSDFDITKIIRTPLFVPESIKADDLFRRMQSNKSHFAVVLDEYGGLGGIITISDLLEEIVGNFSDDDNVSESDITQIGTNTWQILGGCEIEAVSELLDIELPVEEYNTFGGMILGELGAIPDDGSTPTLEAYGLSIKVLSIVDHRIEKTIVAKIDPCDEPNPEK